MLQSPCRQMQNIPRLSSRVLCLRGKQNINTGHSVSHSRLHSTIFCCSSLRRLLAHIVPKLLPEMAATNTDENFDQAEAADFDDDDGLAGEVQLGSTTAGRKRLFSKELRCMMYGFGDDQNPYTESVDLLEDLVIEFITETTHRAMEIGRTGRVQVEDIVFLVRKDQRKYARVKDLLTMNEELKRARKAFDEIKYVGKQP